MAYAYDYWGTNTADSGTYSSSNTTYSATSHRWLRRLRGPGYSVAEATLILVETADHKPQRFAHIAGVQFKRTTRKGKRHYYRAVGGDS